MRIDKLNIKTLINLIKKLMESAEEKNFPNVVAYLDSLTDKELKAKFSHNLKQIENKSGFFNHVNVNDLKSQLNDRLSYLDSEGPGPSFYNQMIEITEKAQRMYNVVTDMKAYLGGDNIIANALLSEKLTSLETDLQEILDSIGQIRRGLLENVIKEIQIEYQKLFPNSPFPNQEEKESIDYLVDLIKKSEEKNDIGEKIKKTFYELGYLYKNEVGGTAPIAFEKVYNAVYPPKPNNTYKL